MITNAKRIFLDLGRPNDKTIFFLAQDIADKKKSCGKKQNVLSQNQEKISWH